MEKFTGRKETSMKRKIESLLNCSFFYKTYSKKAQDQKANYEQEKKRLSPDDLQTVDADEKSRRIELKIKRVFFSFDKLIQIID